MYNLQEKIDKDKLLADNDFIKDASYFLVDRVGYEADDLSTKEDIYDAYMEHFRYQNVNEITAVNDMIYAQNADKTSRDRFGRLMDTYDKMDSDFGLKAAGDYLGGVLFAPSTYAGIVTGGGAKAGALAAQQGVKLGIRQILKQGASGKALRSAAVQGAVRAGAVEGGIGAGQVAAQEQVRVETGLKEEKSVGNIILGGALSATPGAVFGAAAQAQRALTSNVAERVNIISQKKMAQNALRANRTSTKEAVESTEFGDLTQQIYKGLKGRLALEKTIPEELARGKEIKEEFTKKINPLDDDFAVQLELKTAQNIAAAGAKMIKDFPPIEKGEAFTSRLVRALNSGHLQVDEMNAIATKHGIRYSDIGSLLAAEVSQAGSLLGKMGALSKAESKALLKTLDKIDIQLKDAGDTITGKARKELEEKLGKNTLGKANEVMRNINKARIGMMTVQLATTTRNTTNGYMRNFIYAFDNLGAGLYNIVREPRVTRKLLEKARQQGETFGKGKEKITDELIKRESQRAVNLGKAQLRIGAEAIIFKDLMFGFDTATTTTLTKLMQNPAFKKSGTAQRLFMQMGDVANHTGDENSMILKAARYANFLNTKSDNMFKRAIFSREVDKALRAGTYKNPETGEVIKFKNGLSDFLKTGRFGDLDERIIGNAMEEALDFTYQTSKFRGKEGVFNSAAATFIEATSPGTMVGNVGSTFIPFPRYLVNQFRFFYEHAPIVGMFDFGTGILNKSTGAEKFGKQIGGFVALTGLYAMRDFHGDDTTGPFEYKNPYGRGLVNAEAALGPFSTHAFMADYIYQLMNYGPKVFDWQPDERKYPTKKPEFNGRNFTKSLGGGQFRPTGLNLVDGFFDEFSQFRDDNKFSLQLQERAANYIGNLFNTFTVGGGMLKDVVATLDPEYRVVTDSRDIKFLPYVFKQATRSFPYTPSLDRPMQESPTRTGGIKVMNPFMRQITGLTQQEERTAIERELDRLGFTYPQIAPTKIYNDPDLNREAKGRMGKYVEEALQHYILTDKVYNGLQNDIEKKDLLKERLNLLRRKAKDEILDPNRYITDEAKERVARAKYFQFSSKKREMVNLYYERKTGNTIGETKDYIGALFIADEFNL